MCAFNPGDHVRLLPTDDMKSEHGNVIGRTPDGQITIGVPLIFKRSKYDNCIRHRDPEMIRLTEPPKCLTCLLSIGEQIYLPENPENDFPAEYGIVSHICGNGVITVQVDAEYIEDITTDDGIREFHWSIARKLDVNGKPDSEKPWEG